MTSKIALIIGAGPAGLTAAYELLERTDIKPIVFEMSDEIGGISRTVNYKGNRIDIGGHRFFSKSDRVMNWWLNFLPVQSFQDENIEISYQNKKRKIQGDDGPDPEKEDRVFLIRNRLSRIFYLRHFFDYPLTISGKTIKGLGFFRIIKIGLSYVRSMLFQIKPEKTLEDFFINRFGHELYRTFFKDYTEKVWGVPCTEIGADWGAQRIKGLSITRALVHALKKIFKSDQDISQKNTETSLIERFLYPKFGPGQMWEEVANQITEKGGEIHFGWQARSFSSDDQLLKSVTLFNSKNNEEKTVTPDYIISTMPIRELVSGMGDSIPCEVKEVAAGLQYRDFMTVGLLLKKLKIREDDVENELKDNWIYIQESDVNVGRVQLFNNWSPYMVEHEGCYWIGLEYFCNEGDSLWSMTDQSFLEMAVDEMVKIGFIEKDDVIDSTIIRQHKAYPAYFGSYDRFEVVRDFLDKIDNLFLVGRNGMHKYNNQDHSMLSAMTVVDGLVAGQVDRDELWAVNAEKHYHEEKQDS